MKRLYKTVKRIKGIAYVYMGFGRKLEYIYKKNNPNNVNEANVLKLLNALDENERRDLELYDEDRKKLVSLLSEYGKKMYLKSRGGG